MHSVDNVILTWPWWQAVFCIFISCFLCHRRCLPRGPSLKTTWCRTWWPSWTTWSVWRPVLRPLSLLKSMASVTNMERSWNCTARLIKGPSVWSAGNLEHTGWWCWHICIQRGIIDSFSKVSYVCSDKYTHISILQFPLCHLSCRKMRWVLSMSRLGLSLSLVLLLPGLFTQSYAVYLM